MVVLTQTILPIIVSIIYVIVSISFLYTKKYGLALVWGSYASANIGLVIAGLKWAKLKVLH